VDARCDLGRWTLRVRLLVEGARGREAQLERLAGDTRVAEALLLAAEALGVPAGVDARLRSDARELRGEDTLGEAGMEAGGAVELWVGEAGGMMPTVGAGEVLGALDDLQGQVSGFVSVLDLAATAQQGQADALPVFPVIAEVMLLIASRLHRWLN
jgi:hypothetical protein